MHATLHNIFDPQTLTVLTFHRTVLGYPTLRWDSTLQCAPILERRNGRYTVVDGLV